VRIRAVVNDATPVPVALRIRVGILIRVAVPDPTTVSVRKMNEVIERVTELEAKATSTFCGALRNEVVPVAATDKVRVITLSALKVATPVEEVEKVRTGFRTKLANPEPVTESLFITERINDALPVPVVLRIRLGTRINVATVVAIAVKVA